MPNTLRKSERLDRKKVIEKMFAGGSRSFSVFPLRVVYLPVEELEAPVSILVSVSKRRFKRAVKRNRVKRQIREARTAGRADGKKVPFGRGLHLSFGPVGRLFCHRGPYEDSFGTHCREGSGKC